MVTPDNAAAIVDFSSLSNLLLLVPCQFIKSVLPTKHLSGHRDHDDLFELPAVQGGG